METLSCYAGDPPREEQEAETCETEVRSDGMNMEEQEGEAPDRLTETQVRQREGRMEDETICVPARGSGSVEDSVEKQTKMVQSLWVNIEEGGGVSGQVNRGLKGHPSPPLGLEDHMGVRFGSTVPAGVRKGEWHF